MSSVASASGRSAVIAAVLAQAASVVPLAMLGTMAIGIRRDLGLDETMLGAAIALSFASAAAFAMVTGRIVERIGPAIGVRLATGLAAGGMVGFAIGARSWATAVPSLIVMGLAVAVVQPSTDLLLSSHVRLRRLGMAFAIKQTAGGPGMGLMAGLAVPLIATTIGWRAAFVVAAAASSLLVLLAPNHKFRSPSGSSHQRPSPRRERRRDDVPLLAVRVLAFAGLLGTVAQSSFVAFAVSAAVQSGMSERVAASLFAFGSVFGMAIRIAGGVFADRRPERLVVGIAVLLGLSVLGSAAFAVGTPSTTFIAVPVMCATVWGWPGLFFLAIARSSPLAPARASGIASAGVLSGGVLGPLLFGATAAQSYAAAWGLVAVCSVAAAVAMLVGGWCLREARTRGVLACSP